MKLVSVLEVKDFLEKTDSEHDSLLSNLIEDISSRIETFLNRNLTKTEYTEYFNGGRHRYHVKAYPIDTGQTITVSISGTTSYTINNEYYVWEDEGIFEFVTAPSTTLPKQIKLVYTGGYTETNGVLQVPTDIKRACKMQVVFEFRKRSNLGNKFTSLPDGGVSVEYGGDLLPDVKKILKAHRNRMQSKW